MGNAAEVVKFTAAEFLAWDEGQRMRHEYLDGEVFAMAGGEDRHATIALNAAMALRQHLGGTPCRVFVNDVKLQVEAANCFFYPDVFVTCSENDRSSRRIKREAKLVMEVLSPSTAAYDRGEKFARYRQLESLEEMVLIDPDTRRSDVFRRAPEGRWLLQSFNGDQTLELASVDLRIAPAALYADVDDSAPDQQ
jgi:Uma2 family endonuclease